MNKTIFRNINIRLNYFRFVLCCVILQLVVGTAPAQFRKVEMSSQFIDSSPIARTYFVSPSTIKAGNPVHFRFGGGVVPRGSIQFQDTAEKNLNISELKLVVRNKEQLSNSISEYDTFGIEWKGKVYNLYAQDDLVLPLLKFIKRESFIAFTLPELGIDKNYFKEYDLVPLPDGNHFVAKEFSSESHSEFLYEVDYFPPEYLEPIPDDKAILIRKDLNWGKGIADIEDFGTYVNADFHVRYKAYLVDPKDKNKDKSLVEIGGLPLRYHFEISGEDSAIIERVEVFKFPPPGMNIQARAILFFQMAAVFRQFQQENKSEFDRFLKEVTEIVEKGNKTTKPVENSKSN